MGKIYCGAKTMAGTSCHQAVKVEGTHCKWHTPDPDQLTMSSVHLAEVRETLSNKLPGGATQSDLEMALRQRLRLISVGKYQAARAVRLGWGKHSVRLDDWLTSRKEVR